MPHCVLEYSANLPDAPELDVLLGRLHDVLMESGEFARENLKSRAYEAARHCVADGDPGRGFVALSVHILAGRDDTVKARLADTALDVLRAAYPASVAGGRVDLSVQIVDMHRASYRKIGMTDPSSP